MGNVKLVNRSLPSSKNPHFQNEARCTTFLVEMSFICMRIKNDFHIKGWAPTLVLKQRPGETWKWPNCLCFSQGKFSFQDLSSICPKKRRELENEAGFRKKSSQIHKSPEVTGVIRISRAFNQDFNWVLSGWGARKSRSYWRRTAGQILFKNMLKNSYLWSLGAGAKMTSKLTLGATKGFANCGTLSPRMCFIWLLTTNTADPVVKPLTNGSDKNVATKPSLAAPMAI